MSDSVNSPGTAAAAIERIANMDLGLSEAPPDTETEELTEQTGAAQEAAPLASGKKDDAIDPLAKPEEVEDVEGDDETFAKLRTEAGWKLNEKTGKWQKPNGQFAKADELPPIEKEAPKAEAKPPRALATEFTVKDKDGKDIDPHAIADHVVTLKANGKTVTKTVDELARLAQRGFYNEEQQQKAETALVSAQQALQKLEGVEQERDEYAAAWRRVLGGDMEYLQSEMDIWQRENSPEAVARKSQAEVQRLREEAREREINGHAHSYATTRILPILTSLKQQYPSVTEAEIQFRFQGLISPLVGRAGRIPPERFPDMERIASNELAQWVEHTHSTRADEQAKTAEQQQAAINRANGKTIIARRAVHRKLASGATRGGTNDQAAPREKAKSAKEFFDRFNERLESAAI